MPHRRIAGDTHAGMDTVTVRDLRNNAVEVLRRVEHGERIVVTRDGAPVAELRLLPRGSAGAADLIRRRKNLPQVSPDALLRDVHKLIDHGFTGWVRSPPPCPPPPCPPGPGVYVIVRGGCRPQD